MEATFILLAWFVLFGVSCFVVAGVMKVVRWWVDELNSLVEIKQRLAAIESNLEDFKTNWNIRCDKWNTAESKISAIEKHMLTEQGTSRFEWMNKWLNNLSAEMQVTTGRLAAIMGQIEKIAERLSVIDGVENAILEWTEEVDKKLDAIQGALLLQQFKRGKHGKRNHRNKG